MLDLTSTRVDNIQTARVCHLLAAVITQAVRDIATPLSDFEREQQCNLDPYAKEALEWIYGPAPGFGYYCRAVGMDPQAFRHGLATSVAEDVKQPKFSQDDFDVSRLRLSWM